MFYFLEEGVASNDIEDNDVYINTLWDDINTIVFTAHNEHRIKSIFELYNKAWGGRTNEDKTIIFCYSD
jgi:type I site-specific restriction endonuclease